MRGCSSSHIHQHYAESQSATAHFDPGRRWQRSETTSLHSVHPEPRTRLTNTYENLVSPSPEDSAAGMDPVEPISSRFRFTAAAYSSPAPHVPATKSLSLPLLSEQTRSTGYALDGKDNRGRYGSSDGRLSRLSHAAQLVTSPPLSFSTSTSSGVAEGRGSTAVEGSDNYRTSNRLLKSSSAPRITPPPLRLSRAASAGAPLRTKSSGSVVSSPIATATPPPSSYLIPPPHPQDVGKLVVVLDLDETLVYSRGITLYERPGVTQLLHALKGKCELIVWTAGTREYALDVIRIIDTVCAVQHCIYRHPMWWSGDAGCPKDLRMLGRPMDRIILVDNTPSVFRANPRNSLLVSDFTVPYPRSYNAQEQVLSTLTGIFDHVFRRFPHPCLADVLASRRITRQTVYLEDGNAIELNVLSVRKTAESSWAASIRAAQARYAR